MGDFNIYSRMGELDFSTIIDAAKAKTWPKGKRCSVEIGKNTLKAQTYFNLVDEEMISANYDAHEAIDTLFCRELSPEEVMWETNGEPQYADPEFVTDDIQNLGDDEAKRRLDFIRAVANLINNPETLEAIIMAAPKKKNGTFYKNKKYFIASSGIANFKDSVYAIVGIAKTDTQLSIKFEDITCKIGDNEKWDDDFISTYHEGLAVSEEIKKIVNAE